ncbi:MAG TPA: alpha-ribazole phosphatase [Desulfobacteria bacterium]|nr:alpha-ribazole phosphatase [Desulfobacteria bacterium]
MSTVTRLFLVRHGETEWNKDLRYQGHRDIPLSEVGFAQAEKVALRLSKEKLDAIYSSDLSRAFETAKAIGRFHEAPIKMVRELRETNFGRWEGLTYKEIDQQFKEVMSGWRVNPRDVKIPDGESLGEVRDRCLKGLDKILSDNPDRNVLVVAHGGIIRIVVASVLGFEINDYWKIKQDNVSLNIIDFYGKDKGILSLLNDTCHLDGHLTSKNYV